MKSSPGWQPAQDLCVSQLPKFNKQQKLLAPQLSASFEELVPYPAADAQAKEPLQPLLVDIRFLHHFKQDKVSNLFPTLEHHLFKMHIWAK